MDHVLAFLVRIVAAEFLQPRLYMWNGPIFICGTWSETLVPWDTENMTAVSLVMV